MAAHIKELKTNKTQEKERMLAYLDFLRSQVTEDKVNNIIFIVDEDDYVASEVIGDISTIQAIGMFDTAKLAYQLSIFEEG